MTAESLAGSLSGMEMGNEITAEEERLAREAGLVVLFGASDDLAEFRGAIHDEIGCCDGGDLLVTPKGPLPTHEEPCDCDFCGYAAAKEKAKIIEALWDKEEPFSWTYRTTIPHETFVINEDGKPYCRGIVFDLKDLE